jgi:hypothetical protein
MKMDTVPDVSSAISTKAAKILRRQLGNLGRYQFGAQHLTRHDSGFCWVPLSGAGQVGEGWPQGWLPQPKAPCGIGTSGCRHFGGDVRVDMGYRNGAMRHGGSCGAAKTSKITKSTGVRMGPGAGTSEAISIMP